MADNNIFPYIVINSIALLFVIIFIGLILFSHYSRWSQVQDKVIPHHLLVNDYVSQQGHIVELLVTFNPVCALVSACDNVKEA